MRISVIIPTYRRADFLDRAVKSVLSQDYQDVEVVVVDDNGPDSPDRAAAAEKLAAIQDDRVVFVQPEVHLGGGGARNRGIDAATGDYITFLDDDDIYLPGKLSHQAAFMERGFEMSFMDVYMRDAAGVDRERLTHALSEDPGTEALFREHMLRHLTPTAGYMFTREALQSLGGFPNAPSAQEFILMLTAILKPLRIGYLKEALVAQYRHAGERISTGPGKIRGENRLFALKKQHFSGLNGKDRRSIRVRHYATLFYVYAIQKNWPRALLCGFLSAAISPVAALELWKEKKNITGSETAQEK